MSTYKINEIISERIKSEMSKTVDKMSAVAVTHEGNE